MVLVKHGILQNYTRKGYENQNSGENSYIITEITYVIIYLRMHTYI